MGIGMAAGVLFMVVWGGVGCPLPRLRGIRGHGAGFQGPVPIFCERHARENAPGACARPHGRHAQNIGFNEGGGGGGLPRRGGRPDSRMLVWRPGFGP